MNKAYVTLTGERIDLSRLTADERRALGSILKAYQAGEAYPNFVNLVNIPGSSILGGGQWVTEAVATSPLYRVCQDLGDRLGVAQGYLALGRNSSTDETGPQAQGAIEYVSSNEAARRLGVTAEAIRKAVREKRLAAARRIGRTYLFEWKAIEAYAQRSGRRVRSAHRRVTGVAGGDDERGKQKP